MERKNASPADEKHFSEDLTQTQMYGLVAKGRGVGVRQEVRRFKWRCGRQTTAVYFIYMLVSI